MTVYESDRVTAEYDCGQVVLTLKALGKSVRVSAKNQPQPVIGKIAELVRAKGIDPDTRRSYGGYRDSPVIPTEDAEAIYAAVQAIPEVQQERLREERLRLREEIKYILDATEEARERAFNRDIGGIPSYDSPEYQAARAALATFDAAHPEFIALLAAEKEAEIQRHMWD